MCAKPRAAISLQRTFERGPRPWRAHRNSRPRARRRRKRRQSTVVAALVATAKRLGNTPAVCRKAYVHPAIVERYLDERRLDLPKLRAARKAGGLDLEERRVLAFLEAAQVRDEGGARLHKLERSVDAARTKRAAKA